MYVYLLFLFCTKLVLKPAKHPSNITWSFLDAFSFFLLFLLLGLGLTHGPPQPCREDPRHCLHTRSVAGSKITTITTIMVREKPLLPEELRKRRRGYKAGVKRRMKKRPFKPCIPAIIIRSLPNKMDELEALVRTDTRL